ncbi:hypothetical protein ATX11_08940 [Oenococcus oeni]|uniref:alpha/beta hydrolase n=1 Tax=Oenococcus oeni TaxID=1247 RepID=UPI0008F96ABF|nr:alpha/beta hydrolase-fold protein [Oenococcus oeni]OIL37216.1 hypothetical protein ATX11_08940 [Oenococcus oeni]
MATFKISFFSDSLCMKSTINVILPDRIQSTLSTLLLLHGMGDDENSWMDNTSLQRYLSNRQLAVIMPRVDLSYYANIRFGERYFDYVSDELLQKASGWFPLKNDAKHCFAAGISMGAYGALKLVLNEPEKFSRGYALSAVTDLLDRWNQEPKRDAWYKNLFGSKKDLKGSTSDLISIVEQWPVKKETPYIWQSCGTDDAFFQQNETFHQLLVEKNFESDFIPVDREIHRWEFWDKQIMQVINNLDQFLS